MFSMASAISVAPATSTPFVTQPRKARSVSGLTMTVAVSPAATTWSSDPSEKMPRTGSVNAWTTNPSTPAPLYAPVLFAGFSASMHGEPTRSRRSPCVGYTNFGSAS